MDIETLKLALACMEDSSRRLYAIRKENAEAMGKELYSDLWGRICRIDDAVNAVRAELRSKGVNV